MKQAQSFMITSDNTTDLPPEFYAQHQLPIAHVDYTLDDICYDGIIPELDPKQFYERLRAGALPITQQANPHQTRKLLDRFLAEGKDILHLAFSSGLSGTYQSACMAATELREVYPDRKIVVVDTLCASMGEGLMVCTALAMQQQGSTLEEIAQWVILRMIF